MSKSKLTEEQKDEIQALLEAGKSQKFVADKYGISPRTIYRMRQERGMLADTPDSPDRASEATQEVEVGEQTITLTNNELASLIVRTLVRLNDAAYTKILSSLEQVREARKEGSSE